jgi:hypothetical protein
MALHKEGASSVGPIPAAVEANNTGTYSISSLDAVVQTAGIGA